jgi:hypothetical protein
VRHVLLLYCPGSCAAPAGHRAVPTYQLPGKVHVDQRLDSTARRHPRVHAPRPSLTSCPTPTPRLAGATGQGSAHLPALPAGALGLLQSCRCLGHKAGGDGAAAVKALARKNKNNLNKNLQRVT